MMQPESAASSAEPDSPAIKCRLSPEAIALLGTKSDTKIAAEHGVSSETVKYHRTKRGIPAFCFEVALRNDSDFMGKLGNVSDHQLGTQYGCSYATVRGIRLTMGIPAFQWTSDIHLTFTFEEEELADQLIRAARRKLASFGPEYWLPDNHPCAAQFSQTEQMQFKVRKTLIVSHLYWGGAFILCAPNEGFSLLEENHP